MADNAEINDVKDNDMAEMDSASTESSTEETNNPSDGIESSVKLDFSDELENIEPKTCDEDESTELESQPTKGAETRKQQLNTEIRDKVAERNALKREIEELNRQKYQLQSKDDLPTVDQLLGEVNPETGDYFTRTEAQLLLLQAQLELDHQTKQMDEYNSRLVETNMALINEAEQVLRDFPMFDPNSSEYDKDLAEQADRLLDASIIRDPNTGRIIGSQVSPYELYSTIASAAGAAKVRGEVAGRKAAQKMMANVDVVGGAASPSGTDSDDDPFAKGLERDRKSVV